VRALHSGEHKRSFDGEIGVAGCQICNEGYFRPSDDAACEPCLEGAHCPLNSSLATIEMRDGFWRLSPYATRLLSCVNKSSVACLGGSVSGACAPAHGGPLCKTCISDDEYFDSDTGACLDCPDGSGPAVASTLIVVLLAAASAAAYLIFVRPPQSLFMMSQWLNEMVLLLRALGTGAKIRIGVAFYQCITVVATIYLVDMPDEYHHIMDAFDWLQVNWLGALIPEECVGSFELRMVLIVLVPLIVLALTMLVFASVSCFKREPLVNAALNATGPCLLIIFLFAPATNRAVFRAWDCEPYEFSATEDHYYMRSSPLTRCGSSDHHQILAVAFVFMMMWPVGSVAIFLGLALRARRRLLNNNPDRFVRATLFLHGDFKPEYYYWASVELVQRSILTGWVLLVSADKSFLRLIVSFMTSLAVLVWTLIASPYRRGEDNLLAGASCLLLVLTYVCSIMIKGYEDFADADPALTQRVLGIGSSNGIVVLLIIFAFVLLTIMILSVLSRLRTESRVQILRLKESGAPPKLTLKAGQLWLLFISHIWSTGQDQAATVKRQLQRMLPGISIFLDVDDMQNVADLEQYIEQSACILCFLSQGYLASKNCLREIRAAVSMSKPRINVHEADPRKGGATLTEMRDKDCPPELRDAVFGGKKPVQWHRIADFQLVTLKVIAEQILLASPEYSAKPSLPLVMRGEVTAQQLAFPSECVLFTSKANPGADAVAMELQSCINVQHTENPSTAMAQQLASGPDGTRKVRRYSRTQQTMHTVGEATHFLLYLSLDTFVGAVSEELPAHVRAAMSCGMPIILAHENDEEKRGCEFNQFFHTTPEDIQVLYKDILAVALMAAEHREVSMAHLAKKLGAKEQKGKRARAALQSMSSSTKRVLSVGDSSI